MAQGRRVAAILAGRSPLRSPGRPPVNRREERRRFWRLIAKGLSSEEAAVACGVSMPLGPRWFREGGMPPITLAPPSGRYLSFVEREEIAVRRAEECGIREIARRLGRARRRSRGSYGATRRPVAAAWTTGPRSHSGTQTAKRADPRCAGSLRTTPHKHTGPARAERTPRTPYNIVVAEWRSETFHRKAPTATFKPAVEACGHCWP